MSKRKGKAIGEPRFRRRYPWDVWFRRDRFALVQGVDYSHDLKPWAMAQQVRNCARSHGVAKVSVDIDLDGRIEVQVLARFNGGNGDAAAS